MMMPLLTRFETIMTAVRLAVLVLLFVGGARCSAGPDEWQPVKGPLLTRWAKDVSPKIAHPDYPRPQMVREDWLNLNGLWDYAIRPKNESARDF